MEKQGYSYEIIVHTNLCDRSITKTRLAKSNSPNQWTLFGRSQGSPLSTNCLKLLSKNGIILIGDYRRNPNWEKVMSEMIVQYPPPPPLVR